MGMHRQLADDKLNRMILVMYHHPEARRVLVRLLERFGFDAVGFGSGKEALPLMRRQKPRLVFLNGTLEDMCGLDFLHMIRADEVLADTPVYFMSATTDKREEAERLGVIGYGIKPLAVETILKAVADALHQAVSDELSSR
jgi:CheY-like chemotaxis protein